MAGLVPAIHVFVFAFALLDHPPEPVIGPRFARTRWRMMTAENRAAARPSTLMVRSGVSRVSNHEAHPGRLHPPISGLPEIGFLRCASRVNPTCGDGASRLLKDAAERARDDDY